ncbi:MAG: putative signal transducing protein [Bacteroidota bacterium]
MDGEVNKHDQWVCVYQSSDAWSAELISQMLYNNGIANHVINKQDSNYPLIGHLEVYVFSSDLQQANEFIKKNKT